MLDFGAGAAIVGASRVAAGFERSGVWPATAAKNSPTCETCLRIVVADSASRLPLFDRAASSSCRKRFRSAEVTSLGAFSPVTARSRSKAVRYDDAGVPTVRGDDELSLYFAVGYVHAAARLFEMDLIRRRMRGRLSAAVGERTVESDRFHVQMDFESAAEASWRAVEDTPTGEAMRAYTAGVEAQRTSEPLPLEFRLLDYEPAAWTPVDSMLVEKQISWGLTGSFRSLRRSVAADALGEAAAATLYPRRMAHDVPVLRDDRAPVDSLLDPMVGQRYVVQESNASESGGDPRQGRERREADPIAVRSVSERPPGPIKADPRGPDGRATDPGRTFAP